MPEDLKRKSRLLVWEFLMSFDDTIETPFKKREELLNELVEVIVERAVERVLEIAEEG